MTDTTHKQGASPQARLKAWAESAGIGDSMTWVGKDYSIAQAKHDAVEVMRGISDGAGAIERLRQQLGAEQTAGEHLAKQVRESEAYAERIETAAKRLQAVLDGYGLVEFERSAIAYRALCHAENELRDALKSKPEI